MGRPDNILCSKTHEYVWENEGKYIIGLTDFAVEQLGDIVFVEMPEAGTTLTKGDILGTVESVKAASEIYMPISGTVTEVNEALVSSPELLNEDPYEKGWLIKVESDTAKEDSGDLIDYNDYKEEVE